MKAMIFAAGLGTRLKPLTDIKPKALIEINGVTLLEIVVKRLIGFGFKNLIINVHHFADQIIEYIHTKKSFGIDIEISDERELLLDTGGGLKKAGRFFDDGKPFLVHNVDIISNINLNEIYEYHIHQKALATLAVRHRKTSRYLLFNKENKLCGWKNEKTNEIKYSNSLVDEYNSLAFSGIQIISPSIFELMEEQGVFSIINVYLRLAKSNSIKAFKHDDSLWLDVGKLNELKEAEHLIQKII